MTLKLGIHDWVFKNYQVCSNNDPRLTLVYFTARSNLVSYAFVLGKDKTMDFSEHLALFSLRTESDNPDATCELMKLFPLVSLLTIRIFYLSAIHRWKQLLLTTTIPAFRSLPIYIYYLYRYFISLFESAMGVVYWLSCWCNTLATQVRSLAGETLS